MSIEQIINNKSYLEWINSGAKIEASHNKNEVMNIFVSEALSNLELHESIKIKLHEWFTEEEILKYVATIEKEFNYEFDIKFEEFWMNNSEKYLEDFHLRNEHDDIYIVCLYINFDRVNSKVFFDTTLLYSIDVPWIDAFTEYGTRKATYMKG